ncbi:hypothetical protein NC652_036601 [Populus alba x Populus x berolinensis]|nr:hypothetical protein NC652_036601 [Populus alba x Populus x berolinensis]
MCMGIEWMMQMEGDTKGSAKAGDTSAKKDVHPGPNAQISHQGSFSQGVSYGNSNTQGIVALFHPNDTTLLPYSVIYGSAHDGPYAKQRVDMCSFTMNSVI